MTIHLTLTEEIGMFAASSLFRRQPLQGTRIDIRLIQYTEDKPGTRGMISLKFAYTCSPDNG
jgi:hypothetical protein